MTRIGLHVGGDWWTQLYTYAERMHGCQPDGHASQGGAEEGEAA
jgi:hypothetical protein